VFQSLVLLNFCKQILSSWINIIFKWPIFVTKFLQVQIVLMRMIRTFS
jgi:hypothetical protein